MTRPLSNLLVGGNLPPISISSLNRKISNPFILNTDKKIEVSVKALEITQNLKLIVEKPSHTICMEGFLYSIQYATKALFGCLNKLFDYNLL